MNATPAQLQSIHAALHRRGLLPHKADMVHSYTNGRTSSSKDMTAEEASAMLQHLNSSSTQTDDRQKMINKIIAQAWEMKVLYRETVVQTGGTVKEKTNYSRLNDWMLKNSYAKKPLNEYKYHELPKLVSQYAAIYADWLKKKRS